MRSLALLPLVSGCIEVISLDEARVSIAATDDGIQLNAKGPSGRCYGLDRSLVGTANGAEMHIISRGSKDETSNGRFSNDQPNPPDICYPAKLSYPRRLGIPETVTIEITDDTATLVAEYPALSTPPKLALVSTEMVDRRFAITVDPTPHAHLIAATGVYRTTDSGYYDGVSIRVVPDGRLLQLVFPEGPLATDETYVLHTTSRFAATLCEGFTLCMDALRSDYVALDPAWIERANAR